MAPAFRYRPLDPSRKEIMVLRFLDDPSDITVATGKIDVTESVEDADRKQESANELHSAASRGDGNSIESGGHSQQSETKYLRFETETVSLLDDATKDYNAVSYSWGDKTVTRRIILDRCTLDIPAGTFDVLERFRKSKNFNKPIWVDAVCIDQGNDAERGYQVALMRDVYSQADEVLIWLGEDDGTTEDAIRSINLVLEQAGGETVGYGEFEDTLFNESGGLSYSDSPLPEACDYQAIRSFYSCR